MTINVTKYRLNPDRIFGGTRGSYGMEKLSFDFGDGWDFDTISVTFHPQRGKPIRVPLLPGVEIDIPAEVMEHSGETRFVVSGRVIGEDGAIERQAITLEGYVDVAYTADEKGGNTRKITPDVYDQLIDQASKVFNEAREDVEQSATEAEESAKRAEDAAKNINSVAEKANEAIKAAEEAKNAKKAAEQSASNANSAKDTAVTAAEAAQKSANSAAEAKNAAENSANSAGRSAQEAQSAAARAEEAAEEAGKLVENIHETGNGMWYGTTSSGVRESIKEVTTVSGDFKLEKGSKVSVKFLTNSEYCQALNVDGTGAVYIHESYVDGAEDLPTGTAPNLWHNLGQINTFIYDGKYFIVEDGVRATADNQLFGKVGVSDSVTLNSGDYAASSRAVKRAYDKAVEAYEKAGSGGGSGGGISQETDPTVPDWAKQPEKPKYTANEVGALPADTRIPKKTSDLENDSGYITISVATLLNYYLKTEVYAKTEAYNREEVDSLISGLSKRLNAVADSTDIDLDQLSEIVAYIKSNKSLIDSITTSKVSVADIIDNLATSNAKKPLSAAQGKVLKDMYDALPGWAKESVKPSYTKAEIGLGNVDNVRQYSAQNPPPYPVTSVNGMTGAVMLNANHVRARPETWMPSASEVGADPSGTADSKVSAHNVSETSHNDIRLLITGLTNRLNALANSTDDDLDQLAEIVAYIKANKSLIDGITTSKVSVVDIIDNLTTNASNKPLSAKMGVQLKDLIDAIKIPTSLPASDVYAWAKQPNKPSYIPEEIGAQPAGSYALKSEIPNVPVQSVNGKTGAVNLTAADVGATTQEYVDGEIADLKTQGLQQVPAVPEGEAVDDQLAWLAENGDINKIYLLADGYLYQYRKHETIVDGGVKPAFTNLKAVCTYYYKQRYSMSSGAFGGNTTGTAVAIPVPAGDTSVTIRVNGVAIHGSYTAVYGGESDSVFTETLTAATKNAIDFEYTTSKAATTTYVIMNFAATQESDFENVIITVNEPIEYTTGSEVVVTEGFANTGRAFVPADYEARIVSLENKSVNIAKNTNRIEALEGMVGTVDGNAVVHNAVGATYPPAQKPTASTLDGYDIDLLNSTADDVFAYIDGDVNGKETVTKEILGKDESGQYDIARYIYANREYIAWCRKNYPKMYAWKNDSTVVYSTSISPRIGDTMYSTAYVGTTHGTVTAVSAINHSRTVGGVEFVRNESGDISPTVIYTDKDDDRNSNASITDGGIIYNRYPLGDLGANRKKLIPIFVYANEHGIVKDTSASTTYEDKLVGLMAARLLRDFANEKQTENPLYKYIRENCMLIVIPVANPYGFNYNLTDDNNGNGGYYNANKVNINRNYDTPGWDVFKAANPTAATGVYPGSEAETQYIMNTMVESGAAVAMSLHGYASSGGLCAHQGQNPGNVDYNQDKLAKISSFTQKNWGYRFVYYDSEPLQNTPEVTAKSPSYITQCGAYGGILEITSDDNRVSGLKQEANSHVCENAYAVILNSTAMWLSDYLES